ncbi:MAG: hypothetical protein J7L07_02415 [Candidatus Odinarchaeota archaeon]|nr:hypothetical protein [Candidatus Odinarchaeota archaeon]
MMPYPKINIYVQTDRTSYHPGDIINVRCWLIPTAPIYIQGVFLKLVSKADLHYAYSYYSSSSTWKKRHRMRGHKEYVFFSHEERVAGAFTIPQNGVYFERQLHIPEDSIPAFSGCRVINRWFVNVTVITGVGNTIAVDYPIHVGQVFPAFSFVNDPLESTFLLDSTKFTIFLEKKAFTLGSTMKGKVTILSDKDMKINEVTATLKYSEFLSDIFVAVLERPFSRRYYLTECSRKFLEDTTIAKDLKIIGNEPMSFSFKLELPYVATPTIYTPIFYTEWLLNLKFKRRLSFDYEIEIPIFIFKEIAISQDVTIDV